MSNKYALDKIRRFFVALSYMALNGCASDQEPIYHLFDHSSVYPKYSEREYLIGKGFKRERIEEMTYLVGSHRNVELRFQTEDATNDLFRKTTLVYLDEYDSLNADSEISERFNGIRQDKWTITYDSTMTAKVKYRNEIFLVELRAKNGKVYLVTTVDLFHRVIFSK